MIRLIKKTLNISNRHDYFGKFIIINIVLCIITICLSMKNEFSLRANVHLLVEMFISITTCGIFTLYRRNYSEFVFLVSPYEYFAPAEPPIRFIAPPVRVMDPLKSQFT